MELNHLTEDQIQEYLDGGAKRIEQGAAEHLAACPVCRAAVAEYRALYQGLTDDTGFDLPPDFAASVIRQVVPAAQSRSRFLLIYPIAAALLAAAFGLYFFVDLAGFYGRIIGSFSLFAGFEDAVVRSLAALLDGLNLKGNLVVASGAILLVFAVLERLFFNLRRGKVMFFA